MVLHPSRLSVLLPSCCRRRRSPGWDCWGYEGHHVPIHCIQKEIPVELLTHDKPTAQ